MGFKDTAAKTYRTTQKFNKKQIDFIYNGKKDFGAIIDGNKDCTDYVAEKIIKFSDRKHAKLKGQIKEKKAEIKSVNRNIRSARRISLTRIDRQILTQPHIAQRRQLRHEKRQLSRQSRRQAARSIMAKSYKASKEGVNNAMNQNPDNLIAAGNNGVAGAAVKALNDRLNPIQKLKNWLEESIRAMLTSLFAHILAIVLPLLIIVSIVVGVFSSTTGMAENLVENIKTEVTEFLDRFKQGDNPSEEEIDKMVAERKDITEEEEKLLRFVFSKIGCTYITANTQEEMQWRRNAYNSSTNEEVYDCSSLAYFAEKEIGKDITLNRACDQADALQKAGKIVPRNDTMKIGDLIYYADDKHPDRTNGVYHVAVYVGNGYVVHAAGKNKGVLYAKVSKKNLYAVYRP
jgi:hypothetical protein